MKKSIVAAATGAVFMVSASSAMANGKAAYDSICFACHAFGSAGAPKTGDKEAWAPRIEKGMDLLVKHATEGFQGETGFMPAKGGNPSLSDEEVAAAVEYLVSQSK